jgi:hypothetical protein
MKSALKILVDSMKTQSERHKDNAKGHLKLIRFQNVK